MVNLTIRVFIYSCSSHYDSQYQSQKFDLSLKQNITHFLFENSLEHLTYKVQSCNENFKDKEIYTFEISLEH